MKIGVVGGGVVGAATALALGIRHDCTVFDVDLAKSTGTLDEVMSAGLVFVCLPERAVPAFFLDRHKRYVLRSTVPIDTTSGLRSRGFDVCHWPEFLSERTSSFDALFPKKFLVGGEGPAADTLLEVIADRWPNRRVIRMPSSATEAVKLAQNAYTAVRVAFFNETKKLADAVGVDWWKFAEALTAGCIAHPCLVPGPDGRPGFGGRCLPKDAERFCDELRERGFGCEVTWAALARNRRDRCEQ